MKIFQHNKFLECTIIVAISLLLTTCQIDKRNQTPIASPGSPSATLQPLKEGRNGSISSLEKIDEYPFYVMHYSGSYDYPQIGGFGLKNADFYCSLFASLGGVGDMLYGRNFDWEFSPALLLFTDPPDGYASASMVDLTFLDFSSTAADDLMNLPAEQQASLLAAPSMPFDGLNEYGLAVGMAALPDVYLDDASYYPLKPMIGSIGIIRQVLDHARDVGEALEIFREYNIDFRGGPPIHYLLADRKGEAVLIEFYQGEMKTLPNETPWHLATNHLRTNAQGDGGCWRYRTLSERLTSLSGELNAQAAMQLLSEVKQGITQWSVVYDISSGDIHVALGGNYENTYTYHLELKSP
jgi:hypothetical protein